MAGWKLIIACSLQIALIFITTFQAPLTARTTEATAAPEDWVDTGITLPTLSSSKLCVDSSQPNSLLAAEQTGTVAYDWVTRERLVVSPKRFDICGPNGLLYTAENAGSVRLGPALRFSREDQAGKTIPYMPTHTARDGTSQVYALGYPSEGRQGQGQQLMASADGGLNWEERGKQFNGALEQIAVSYADAQSIFALVFERKLAPPADRELGIYFSSDAGNTWELRTRLSTVLVDEGSGNEEVNLSMIESNAAPISTLVVKVTDVHQASNSRTRQQVFVSVDGARTLSLVAEIDPVYNNGMELFHTHEGILRWQVNTANDPARVPQYEKKLDLSTDGGRSWEQLPMPIKQGAPLNWGLTVIPGAPGSVYLWGPAEADSYGLYYSADGGRTWQLQESNSQSLPMFTPYFPLEMLAFRENRLYVRKAPEASKTLATRTIANNRREGEYFPQTGHNLSGAFRDYWRANGGLARQGYPLTETFWEVSDTNGKVYLVQYFERAVFEMHPENADPQFRVLLSQLGTLHYKKKYPGGAPGQAPNNSPNSILFPETGKRLGDTFLEYWQRNGGLMQQGYPITDEFTEVSELDGKPYHVQYFERAVFEMHPENSAPYNVLLSQLGTFHYRQKYGSNSTN